MKPMRWAVWPGTFLRCLLFLLAVHSCPAGFAELEGTVYVHRADDRVPARALVAIRAASNGRFIAAVRTDSQGRYRLTGHPRGKIILSASRPGHYTKLAAGRQGSEVPLDCSAGCSFSEVDFELGRGSVIGGVVVDEFGEGVERAGVFVEAWKPRFQKKIDTDDRGGFRVAGLRPATYVVRARFGGRHGATQSNPVRIQLGEGAEKTDLELRLGRQNFDGQLRSTARAGRRGSGRNRTANRPPGARVNGSVKLEGGASPSQFRLVFRDRTSSKHWVQVRRPGYHFTLDRMKPGSYRIDTSSQDVYIKGVLQDDKVVPVKDVTISQGDNRLDIVAAADFGRVFGTIRAPVAGGPLPLARVALDGKKGIRSAQADQNGRFSFSKVVPGEYRICAWTDLDPDAVSRRQSWKAAGCENKIIPVVPDSEVQIDLTAAP